MTRWQGNDDRIGIGAAGAAHSARSSGEAFGQFAVGARLARRDQRNPFPNAALEGRSGRRKRQAQFECRILQVGAQLAHRLHRQQGSGGLFGAGFEKVYAEDLIVIAVDAQREAWRGDDGLIDLFIHGLLGGRDG